MNMEIIIHRVNNLNELKNTSQKFGTEIDIRAYGSKLILSHEPFQNGDFLEDYLDEYQHGTLILNIKEAGIEDDVLKFVRMRPQIISYFLLDVEFPYIFRAARNGERAISIRFSEDESIETVKKYIDKVDWVWIDTNTQLPITQENLAVLNQFKKCLVCPECWGRPEDTPLYRAKMEELCFEVDAIMTNKKFIKNWIQNSC